MKILVTFKTQKQLKKSASKLAAKFGLTLSDILNVSLIQFVNTRQLNIGEPWRMSPALEKTLAKAETDLAKGKLLPVYDNVVAAAKSLSI
jgi:antitoxin component of RelBE/YafQ-DinJ toxin-antitoxin module